MNKKLEEAIKILNHYLEMEEFDNAGNFLIAIETVLQALKNSIPKEVIEDKRNILEKQYKEALEENSTKAFILKCQIEILKELLEES